MSDYIEVLDETDPGSNLVGDTLIHTDMLLNTIVKIHSRLPYNPYLS